MKYIFMLLTISLLLSSCGDFTDPDPNAKRLNINYGPPSVRVIVVDECEYIVAEEYQRGISIVHKQNCKFCEQRKQQQ